MDVVMQQREKAEKDFIRKQVVWCFLLLPFVSTFEVHFRNGPSSQHELEWKDSF